jgi:F-type H+-transporting ATPase subunit delta
MHNPRLASRYAKSLLDLAVERNSLEATLNDMKLLNELCRQSRDFGVMLSSPVINSDKKISVIRAVLTNYPVSDLTKAFIELLVNKGREANLHDIAIAFITQYNDLKKIRTVTLTTATAVSDSVRGELTSKISEYLSGDSIELKTAVDQGLIGGFVLEVEDKLYDASVKKRLADIRSKVLDHSFENRM